MGQEDEITREVERFIRDEIDSVPHLEALLLLWNNRPKQWSIDELTKSLYVIVERTQLILQDLEKRKLIGSNSDRYFYQSSPERDRLIEALDRVYRRELVRVSNMIHSKASPSVREFARAFRLKKD